MDFFIYSQVIIKEREYEGSSSFYVRPSNYTHLEILGSVLCGFHDGKMVGHIPHTENDKILEKPHSKRPLHLKEDNVFPDNVQ